MEILLNKSRNNKHMKKFLFITALLGLIASCTEQQELDKLKDKRNKLKSELAEIEQQIAAMEPTASTVLAPLVTLQEVKIERFAHQIEVQGNIETEKDALINAESGGIIREISVKEGQRVSKGQVLMQLDAAVISESINELNTAIEFAQYNYEKQKELFDKGVGSEYQLKQAKSNLDNLKSKLQGLKTQRGKYAIVAPFDGVIDQIFPKIGEMAGPQSPVIRLVNNREVKVSAEISERLYGRIGLGTPVRISIPSLNDSLIEAKITTMGNYIHPTNRTFRILAAIPKNEILLPNMLANIKLTDYVNEQALVLPSASVMKDRENQSYVFVASAEKDGLFRAKRINVHVIESYNGVTEISPLENVLKPGEQVVVQGAKGITEGDLIRTK
jgi:membrane fusion protein, multidrug efflux system